MSKELMDNKELRNYANDLNNQFNDLRTKNGLLYKRGLEVELPFADWEARKYGFIYVERLVKYLEKRS